MASPGYILPQDGSLALFHPYCQIILYDSEAAKHQETIHSWVIQLFRMSALKLILKSFIQLWTSI